MIPLDDDILDDLFHGCAFAAYVELAIQCGGVPDREATRRLAFRYYEEELAIQNSRERSIASVTPPPGEDRTDHDDTPHEPADEKIRKQLEPSEQE